LLFGIENLKSTSNKLKVIKIKPFMDVYPNAFSHLMDDIYPVGAVLSIDVFMYYESESCFKLIEENTDGMERIQKECSKLEP